MTILWNANAIHIFKSIFHQEGGILEQTFINKKSFSTKSFMRKVLKSTNKASFVVKTYGNFFKFT